MRKTISILLATSILITTLLYNGSKGSAQSGKSGKSEDALTKSLKKSWDKLPPQAKLAADPRAKEALDKLTPRQQELLRGKVRDIIRKGKEKGDKERQARLATLKTWDDVLKSEGPDKGEDATLTFVDNAGGHHSFKARQRDGSIKPQRGSSLGEASLIKGNQVARPASPKPAAPGFAATLWPRAPGRSGAYKLSAPWEENWAFDPGASDLKRLARLHYVRPGAAVGLNPQAGCTKGPEQFIRTFYEAALVRPPNASELAYWINAFAQAQAQGTLLSAAQNLGFAIFGSQEYANRGRANRDFVFDCYAAFLARGPDQGGWDGWTSTADTYGQATVVPGFAYSIEFNNDVNAVCSVATFDGDNDGLPDSFENALADAFTPNYHVSGSETDNYATFLDSTTLNVKQRFGQNPVSHFRVLPLSNPVRFNPHSGRWESLLRIDYLSLWDHDSGLVGDYCGLGGFPGLEGTGPHELDGERSALLVSAPAACSQYGCEVNTDPNAYSALSVYTAAHENTFVDESMYDDFPGTPKPAGTHLDMWQSLSKHSTYTFDPDFFPILQISFIGYIFYEIEIWFSDCRDDPFWDEFFFDDPFPEMSCIDVYYSVLRIAVLFIFTCFVERFFEQGGTLANIRINVGEPPGSGGGFGIAGGNPINGSSFILDNSNRAFHLYNKLIEPLRFESLIQ
jgi:hypothetical protein